MFDYQLFLAFPVSKSYQDLLIQVSDPLRALFIQQTEGEYLQEINDQGIRYLGKNLGPSIELEKLEFVQTHIFSVLKRIVQNYVYEEELIILALPKPEASAN
jgi:hypothetical protein